MTPQDFHGDDYKRMKAHYDELMHFRKTVKGKPTLEQRLQLICNNEDIEFYQTVLFHDGNDFRLCDCRRCQFLKQGIDIYAPYQLHLFDHNRTLNIPIEQKIQKALDEYKA